MDPVAARLEHPLDLRLRWIHLPKSVLPADANIVREHLINRGVGEWKRSIAGDDIGIAVRCQLCQRLSRDVWSTCCPVRAQGALVLNIDGTSDFTVAADVQDRGRGFWG